MDQLIKQTKFKFSGPAGADESGSSKDKRIGPQRTVSFNAELAEMKRSPSWLERQFSGQNNIGNELYEIQQETAVAVGAAAMPIASMEGSTIPENRMSSEFTNPFISRRTSRTGSRKVPTSNSDEASRKNKDTRERIGPGKITPASDDEKPAKIVRPASQIDRNPSSVDTAKRPNDIARPASQIERNPSSVDMEQTPDAANNEKPSQQPMKPEPSAPIPTLPSPSKPGTTQKTAGEKTADKWEKQELARIKERYDDVKETILSWENSKKEKAKNRLNKKKKLIATERKTLTEDRSRLDEKQKQIEAERGTSKKAESEIKRNQLDIKQKKLDIKMLKVSEEYKSEIASIDQVAGEARAKAEKKRKKNESKARENAERIQETGKVPRESPCC